MKHAPHAPGPRPDTWWKSDQGKLSRHAGVRTSVKALVHAALGYPIYTAPEPKRPKDPGVPRQMARFNAKNSKLK